MTIASELQAMLNENEQALQTIHREAGDRALTRAEQDNFDTLDAERRDIVEAIEAGDAEAAEACMIKHLRRIFDYIDEAREKYPDYFETVERAGAVARR